MCGNRWLSNTKGIRVGKYKCSNHLVKRSLGVVSIPDLRSSPGNVCQKLFLLWNASSAQTSKTYLGKRNTDPCANYIYPEAILPHRIFAWKWFTIFCRHSLKPTSTVTSATRDFWEINFKNFSDLYDGTSLQSQLHRGSRRSTAWA